MDSLEFVYCLATLRIYIFFTVASAIIVVSGLCYKYIPEVYEIINVRGEHRLDMARWFMLGFGFSTSLLLGGNAVMWAFLNHLMANNNKEMVDVICSYTYIKSSTASSKPILQSVEL